MEKLTIKKIDHSNLENESISFYKCLKSWLDTPDHKKIEWAKKNEDLKVYVASCDGKDVGFVQVVPIETSHVTGQNMHFIQCSLVSMFEDYVGNYQRKGIGRKLLQFVIDDLNQEPKDAIVVTSMAYFGEEVALFFEDLGFERIDKKAFQSFDEIEYEYLLWMPFQNVEAPKFIEESKDLDFEENKLVVFSNGWCRSCNVLANLAIEISEEYGIEVIEVSTLDRDKYLKYGIMDGIYFNNKKIEYDGSDYETKLRKVMGKADD